MLLGEKLTLFWIKSTGDFFLIISGRPHLSSDKSLADRCREITDSAWLSSKPHHIKVTAFRVAFKKKNAVKHHSLQEGQADSILSRRSLFCWKLTWERKAPPFLLTPRGSGLTGSGLVHLLSASQNNLEAIVRSKLIVWMQIGTGMA